MGIAFGNQYDFSRNGDALKKFQGSKAVNALVDIMRQEGKSVEVSRYLAACPFEGPLPERLTAELRMLRVVSQPWEKEVSTQRLREAHKQLETNTELILHKSMTVLPTACNIMDQALVIAQSREEADQKCVELMSVEAPTLTDDAWSGSPLVVIPHLDDWNKFAINYAKVIAKSQATFKRVHTNVLANTRASMHNMLRKAAKESSVIYQAET